MTLKTLVLSVSVMVAIAGVPSRANASTPDSPQSAKPAAKAPTPKVEPVTWQGCNGTGKDRFDWNNAANWAGGAVPTATDDVLVSSPKTCPGGGANTPQLTTNDPKNKLEVRKLTLDVNATLDIAGGALTIHGELTLQAGSTLSLAGKGVVMLASDPAVITLDQTAVIDDGSGKAVSLTNLTSVIGTAFTVGASTLQLGNPAILTMTGQGSIYEFHIVGGGSETQSEGSSNSISPYLKFYGETTLSRRLESATWFRRSSIFTDLRLIGQSCTPTSNGSNASTSAKSGGGGNAAGTTQSSTSGTSTTDNGSASPSSTCSFANSVTTPDAVLTNVTVVETLVGGTLSVWGRTSALNQEAIDVSLIAEFGFQTPIVSTTPVAPNAAAAASSATSTSGAASSSSSTAASSAAQPFFHEKLGGLRITTRFGELHTKTYGDILFGRVGANGPNGTRQLKLEGFFPLPIASADFIFFAGSAVTNIGKSSPTNSDTWRFVIAVDAIDMIKNHLKGS